MCRRDEKDEAAVRVLATAYEGEGNNYRVLHRPKEGVASCLRTVPLRERMIAAHPHNPLYEQDHARTLHVLGLLYQDLRQWGDALKTLQRATNLAERTAAEHPAVTLYQQDVAGLHLNLANAYRLNGKIPWHRRATPRH